MFSSRPLPLAQEIQCELDMSLLSWDRGELDQTGHGRPGDIGPEEAHMRQFTVARLGRVKLLACGSSHSIVITVDNKIFAWGNGTSGQLGDGERSVKDQPVEVKLPQEPNFKGSDADVDVVNIVGVACGSRHSFIWTETGQAYSFGNNFYAQLGYDFQRADFKEHQLAPRLFQSLPSSLKISQVACGERHTLFALEDGSVAACGQNDYGQIGCGSNENVVVPRFVECVHHVSKVTCGSNHNLALTGDGRLFQWGCGRACGNIKRNILFPEEVTLSSSAVRDIAGGCWHSLLLTDGGNVFSWGMGQEGQLGLGDDRIQISTPCLLSYSQLAEVTQIQAGDSYSAAVAAGGELLLWGQIPCVCWVSDHPGLKRLWTPQPVPLAGRKVCDVACGTWHMMALITRSREKNRECAHPETESQFRDPVSNPLPTECTEKENKVQASRQVQHKLLQGMGRPEGSEEQEKDEASESAEEEERHDERLNKDEGDGALHDSAFAIARSAAGMDRRGNGHSSIKSNQGDEREGCKTAGPWELWKEPCKSRGSRDIVFTTVHVLPRSQSERCRPTAGTLPRLLTGQQAHCRVLAEVHKEGSTHLAELAQQSGSESRILQSPRLRPKPRPPGGCTGPAAQSVALCHRSRILNSGLKSLIFNSSHHLSPGQQVQTSSPSFHPRPQVETPLSPTPFSSERFRYSPIHRRVASSFDTSWENL
ncbi:RCC1 domain-containing protein RUG3, mitochondrial-like isoform X1 [Micropterus salmoides]|uniref:RCC1 domain-containing protein RUG3, mitochondrial-like isoform X1 n=2 Tax=Micropterus salmoides TaxID=27706 RepID=UPI0018EC6763|nr:RCC1 domain-containing protein RUG3, mitochondrial-like isoform X1 [Micropterus salmoides]XP_038560577.1 RCC1 domain-containing protein RUG3, mitochondrial-like isoform X1 [Micropterus salmoides]